MTRTEVLALFGYYEDTPNLARYMRLAKEMLPHELPDNLRAVWYAFDIVYDIKVRP